MSLNHVVIKYADGSVRRIANVTCVHVGEYGKLVYIDAIAPTRQFYVSIANVNEIKRDGKATDVEKD